MSNRDHEPGWVLVVGLVVLVAAGCLGILVLLWSRG